MSEQLFFHLRGYRKRANLTQRELAELLGYSSDAMVTKYEKRHRIVNLENALRFQAVFRTPVHELFAKDYAKVELAVINRARAMHATIQCRNCSKCRECQKRAFLEQLIEGSIARAPTSIWSQKKTMPPS
ncbi:MAG: helix-turn-helix transcriptional regulator [Pseudomonadota bacterium]